MANTIPALKTNGLGKTQRRDQWWVEPLLTAVFLSLFGVYATLRAFEGDNYTWGPYISPFCSPNLKEWFPNAFSWWQFSPAILILPFPLLFRATCYYYRKAYYRAYFLDPPACAVGEPRAGSYKGETAFPFVLQNLHRYAFYIAAIFVFILTYDAVIAYDFGGQFGIGLGSLVLTLNVVLLGLYTFSCHSWRHIIGGNLNCFSCANFGKERHGAWSRQSFLNEHHMLLAWISLFSVWLADLYIYLLATGAIQDVRFF